MNIKKNEGVVFALASAVLFGASTPIAKLLTDTIEPILLASLLYLGSALGLGIYLAVRRMFSIKSNEAPLQKADIPWLIGTIFAGGVIAPLMLMIGLTTVSGSAASLLLNMEGVFTITLAWFLFRESFDRRIAVGAVFILAGGAVLSWQGSLDTQVGFGILFVLIACLSWALDNNLTRKISAGDPVKIAFYKGLVGGLVNLGIAFSKGTEIPSAAIVSITAIIGLAGYGLSLVLFVLSLRHIGTARTGAYFSTAPFIGSILAILYLGDGFSILFLVSALLMAIGVYLHLTERHHHSHEHESFVHEHRHGHDEHHQHNHEEDIVLDTSHSHPHSHTHTIHSHPHFPDIHHRHKH